MRTPKTRPIRPDPSAAAGDFGVNAGLVEEIRARFRVDPGSVDAGWGEVFREADAGEASEELADLAHQHAKTLRLIHAYRSRGHRIARIDPLGESPSTFPELDPAHYGFGEGDLDRPTLAGDLPGGPLQTLRQILDRLRDTYCRTVGVEFTHVQDPGRKLWLRLRMEHSRNHTSLEPACRLRVLEKLSEAESFERFLHTRFVAQKRFSLEGAESLIPLLDTFVEEAGSQDVRELVIGMAHRGRLNVLCNVLGKSLEAIFSEFEDGPRVDEPFGSGDVKYHKGFSSERGLANGESIHLSLTANPSHLEAVGPVLQGRARAKQRRAGDRRGERIVPLLIHGDAAFAGQGVVAETLNLANLAGYSTGGTLHVVVNNQIGFTTTPSDARSTLHATDVAKMIQAPIFHVNADDPDAVVHCAKLAFAYRQRFHGDVVIDLVCYRRHGHNEGDEPGYTQPLLYERIRRREPVRVLYAARLVDEGILDPLEAEQRQLERSSRLQRALDDIETRPPAPDEPFEPRGPWTGYSRTLGEVEPDTAVPLERLATLADEIARLPEGFSVHPKLRSMIERRRRAVCEDAPLDWGAAEALAFASLLDDGHSVRLSGQDSARGTFSHRHAALFDQQTGRPHVPLACLARDGVRFEVVDSLLSEAAVLGFEYGYSLADPTTLTLWEAQFGDFANGAQVIIDQFISSAHDKWGRMSGLVMLLPHGYEGQGPEHSSARVERFLAACAGDNLQVANCTTPAQLFHVLRRQMLRSTRRPLVLFTPKSLLRDRRATSRPAELAAGRFEAVLGDPHALAAAGRVRRVVLCSGKLYYELLEDREARPPEQAARLAIVRIEQLHPWPEAAVAQTLAAFPQASSVVWAQEEPANMGAWGFLRERLRAALRPGQRLVYAGRREAASPAAGSLRVHREEQAALIAAAHADLD